MWLTLYIFVTGNNHKLNFRKLPQVPANANTAVGGGPTLTTSVTKTRTSVVRPSKSFNLPFGFGRGGSTNQSQGQVPPGPASSRMSRGAKLPVVPGTQPAQNGGFFGSIGNFHHKIPSQIKIVLLLLI